MRRQSESLLLVPLLPIFLVGMFPMLLLALLGFFGLGIFGMLLLCVGLTSTLEAHNNFNQDVITHGFARSRERAVQASDLRNTIHFAALLDIAGAALIAAAVLGLLCSG